MFNVGPLQNARLFLVLKVILQTVLREVQMYVGRIQDCQDLLFVPRLPRIILKEEFVFPLMEDWVS